MNKEVKHIFIHLTKNCLIFFYNLKNSSLFTKEFGKKNKEQIKKIFPRFCVTQTKKSVQIK